MVKFLNCAYLQTSDNFVTHRNHKVAPIAYTFLLHVSYLAVATPAVSVSSIATQSAVLSWTAATEHLEEHTNYRIVSPVIEVTQTAGNNSYLMRGLSPCVEYMVMVVAYIEGVEGEMEGSVRFTTLPQG